MKKILWALILTLAPSLAHADLVRIDPAGRDGLMIDTANGDLVLRRAGANIVRWSKTGQPRYIFGRSPSVFDTFGEGAVTLATRALTGAAAVLTTSTHNLAYTDDGNAFLYAALGAGQTLNLALTATGLNIAGDQTSTEGYELTGGVLGASGRPFIIGTDPAFKFCVTATIDDASGASDFHVGFRRPEVVNATFANYAEIATIGASGTANPNTIKIVTNLAGAGDVTTDTTNTWADAASKKLCALVSATGVATYTINGVAPTATAAFTFTDGEPVIPWVWYLQGADLADAVNITEWEVGLQQTP